MEGIATVTTVAVYESHRLIQMKKQCPRCLGTLYRLYPDGTIECSACKNQGIGTNVQKEQQPTPKD